MKAVVQLRGEKDLPQDKRDTLKMLNIHNVNHCAFVPDTDTYTGMVTKVNDHVAYGEPSVETLATLLRKRAEPLQGKESVDDEWLADNTDYDSFESLAEAIHGEETHLKEQGLAPVLRLHPPRGGHRGIKHPTKEGGQLGKHSTEQIDELLEDMR